MMDATNCMCDLTSYKQLSTIASFPLILRPFPIPDSRVSFKSICVYPLAQLHNEVTVDLLMQTFNVQTLNLLRANISDTIQ